MKVRKQALATINIPIDIYGSIQHRVKKQDKEFAWFGDIEVLNDDPYDLSIQITDIYLYPQEVSSASVEEPDRNSTEYIDWYTNKLAEAKGKPVMQYYGHSHVGMGVSPSGTDMDMRDQERDLNVFSIHNNKGEMSWEIWTKDYIYTDNDIRVLLTGTYLANVDEMIKEHKVTKYPYANGATYHNRGYQGYTPTTSNGNTGNSTSKKAQEVKEGGSIGTSSLYDFDPVSGLDRWGWSMDDYLDEQLLTEYERAYGTDVPDYNPLAKYGVVS
jgi:hypothetical protein